VRAWGVRQGLPAMRVPVLQRYCTSICRSSSTSIPILSCTVHWTQFVQGDWSYAPSLVLPPTSVSLCPYVHPMDLFIDILAPANALSEPCKSFQDCRARMHKGSVTREHASSVVCDVLGGTLRSAMSSNADHFGNDRICNERPGGSKISSSRKSTIVT
jgi:hypothetical protein